jgi:hypothetical protein
MAETPSFVAGRPEEWAGFAGRHQRFLELFPVLKTAVNAAFQRKWESDRQVDPVVFYTGIICTEEFLEILLLVANGYGVAALRGIRGMFERVVTIRYLSTHPDEADAYLDYHLVQSGKIARALLETAGPGLDDARRETLNDAIRQSDAVKPKFMIPDCERCGTMRPNHTWTRKDIVTMARSDPSTAALLAPCYYEPMSHAHATAHSFLSRMMLSGEGAAFDTRSQTEEADRALFLAHTLLLNVLELQLSHFELALDAPLAECKTAFCKIWGPASAN